MVYVAFYSGFKATTVTNKIGAIQDYFGDLDKVSKYDESKVQKIIDSNKVINHRQKINGIIHNAKQIKAIQKNSARLTSILNLLETQTKTTTFSTW